jgi:methylated-DNA-[protein]-cysteine S-methyltransferase
MGSIAAAPSGVNCERKIRLLAGEGVWFDDRGYLLERERVWDEFEFEN